MMQLISNNSLKKILDERDNAVKAASEANAKIFELQTEIDRLLNEIVRLRN